MKSSFVDIGNRVKLCTDRIVCIIDADAEKVRRLLQRHDLERSSGLVIDATSVKETKSLLILDDGRVAISSMTSNVIIKRADKDLSGELED